MAKITKVRAGAPTPGLIKPIPGPLPKGVIDIGIHTPFPPDGE